MEDFLMLHSPKYTVYPTLRNTHVWWTQTSLKDSHMPLLAHIRQLGQLLYTSNHNVVVNPSRVISGGAPLVWWHRARKVGWNVIGVIEWLKHRTEKTWPNETKSQC